MEYIVPNFGKSRAIPLEFPYRSRAKQWSEKASVRTAALRPLQSETHASDIRFFPIEYAPLAQHPLVKNLGTEALRFIEVQHAYHYIGEIAYTEMELINKVAQDIFSGNFPFLLPSAFRMDMLSIIIDEAYHTYAAIDFSSQVQAITHIPPLELENDNRLQQAIAHCSPHFRHDPTSQAIFSLFAIGLYENIITDDLVTMKKATSALCQYFDDHMQDEGRHASLFQVAMKQVWQALSKQQRHTLGQALADFLLILLDPALLHAFHQGLLNALGLSEQAEQILTEVYPQSHKHLAAKQNRHFIHLIGVLKRTNVFNHLPTKQYFEQAQLL